MREQSEIASKFPTKNAKTSANLEKKVIALLKVRIKMQCCFKCRRGSWPLLIFAICLSIAAPASSYLLLIFPLQMFWVQQSPDDIGVVVLTVVVLVFLAFCLLLIFSLMRSDVVVLTLVVAVSLPSPQLFFLNVLCPAKSRLHGCAISWCGGVGVSSFLLIFSLMGIDVAMLTLVVVVSPHLFKCFHFLECWAHLLSSLIFWSWCLAPTSLLEAAAE